MKIAHITAGAAGMYCGSCLHDNTLARVLHRRGIDMALIPTYTPIRTDEVDVSMKKVFFGGINVYLQQKSAIFRHTPWFFDKLFENRLLLNWVSRFSASTDARDLGALTVSVLKGEEGNQKKEVAKLVCWLADEFKPDLVQLPNAMYVGFARTIKAELGVPVLCSLQGEDLFLDGLVQPYRDQAMSVMRARAGDVDAFVATSAFYRDYMADYLQVPVDKVHAVSLGVDLSDMAAIGEPVDEGPFNIGFLARNCPEKGLDLLIDAFAHLVRDLGEDNVHLRVAGYLSPKDKAYFEQQRQKVMDWGLNERVTFMGELDRGQKIAFLRGLHAFSVPAPYKEPKGLFLLEALANGVPVVQPDHGAFSEIVRDTGGGILVPPGEAKHLAMGLKSLIEDRVRTREMGASGHRRVHETYSAEAMADRTLKVYHRYLERKV